MKKKFGQRWKAIFTHWFFPVHLVDIVYISMIVIFLSVAPLWCDLGFVPDSRGNKAAANLRPILRK